MSELQDEPADIEPDEVEKQEQIERVRELLKDLGERQREAILLRFFEEQSVDETAASMDCSPGTVKATVFQAIRILREKMIGKKTNDQ